MQTHFKTQRKRSIACRFLDKMYPPAIGIGEVVFKGEDENKMIAAYSRMMSDLALYLNQNNFRWNSSVKIFNRVYFEPDGGVSYYLVNLVPTGLTTERQQSFLALLNKFIQHYKIKITAKSRFAQCSPVVYTDITKI